MSNETVKVSYHCAWQIHYPLVFRVKYRQVLLDSEVTHIIKKTASGIAHRYFIEIEATGCEKDYIHLLCGAHPKVAPAGTVQIFKDITARQKFRDKPSVKKELWAGELWADGYCVATVGERANWNTVKKYLKKKGKPETELIQLKLFDWFFDTLQLAAGSFINHEHISTTY